MRPLLYFPVVLWLLLPPGICLGKLPRLLGLAGLAAVECGGRAFADTDDDHPPSCPCKKTANGLRSAPPAETVPAPEPVATVPPGTVVRKQTGPLCEFVPLGAPPGDPPPRYLLLRALRI